MDSSQNDKQTLHDGVATVVISYTIVDGAIDDYLAWQDRLINAAKQFPGYMGWESIRPVDTYQQNWMVVWRFQSSEQLKNWLDSDIRKQIIKEGEGCIQTPLRMATRQSATTNEVTVSILHRVKEGKEKQFLEQLQKRQLKELKEPGCTHTDVFKTIDGDSHEWVAIYCFENQDYANRWTQSSKQKEFLEELSPFVEKLTFNHIGHSAENWFSLKASNGLVWKRPMLILLGLYPVVVLSAFYIIPWLSKWLPNTFLALWVGTAINISLLTWVMMPLITHFLDFWLRADTPPLKTALGLIIVILTYALFIVGFTALG